MLAKYGFIQSGRSSRDGPLQIGYHLEVVERYRLRFLLQEFDLRGPEVVIGRSPECHITIEDPLVSRRHARISIGTEGPTVSDLGSRNGVRVNGTKIDQPRLLQNGDRLRLGTQELVFYKATRGKREARTTGFMTVCRKCQTPYPESSKACPHCGEIGHDEDTMSGLIVQPRRTWTFQLLGEVIERALATGRLNEAVRMLRKAAREIDERLTSGEHLDVDQLTVITSYALQLAAQGGDIQWMHWAFNVHRQQGLFPSPDLIDRLEALDLHHLDGAGGVISDFVSWVRTERDTLSPPPPLEAVDRLDRLAT